MQNRTIIIVGSILLVLIVGVIWYATTQEPADPQRITISGQQEQVTNEDQYLEFTYYSGEEGYTLLESSPGTEFGNPQLVKAYTLVGTDRYNANNQDAAGVGSEIPSISILIFNESDPATTTAAVNTKGPTTTDATTSATSTETVEQSLTDWAAAHSGFTAYGLRDGEPESTTVDGARAIHYRAAGPFQSEVYVIDYRDKYYVVIGQYETEDSDIRQAFEKLMTQIFFL